jgi:hypothetical protein
MGYYHRRAKVDQFGHRGRSSAKASTQPEVIVTIVLGMLVIVTLTVAQGSAGRPQARAVLKSGSTDQSRDAFGGYRVLERLGGEAGPLGGLAGPFPSFVFEDRDGRFWIALERSDGGILLYDEKLNQWDLFAAHNSGFYGLHLHGEALLPQIVSSMCQGKDGEIWFSDKLVRDSDSGKILLTCFDGKRWRASPVGGRAGDYIGLARGIDGRVWFWVGDELRYWEGRSWVKALKLSELTEQSRPEQRSKLVRASAEPGSVGAGAGSYSIIGAMQDREGYIWLSTFGGVLAFDPRTGSVRKYTEIGDPRAGSIYEDRRGRIWFNANPSAIVYDKSNGAIATYTPLDHIPKPPFPPDETEYLAGIYQDKRGRIVFATTNGVVFLTEAENRWGFAHVKELGLDLDRGRITNELRSIMGDSLGRIWLVGFAGIAVLGQ